jgi:hypothetical protein
MSFFIIRAARTANGIKKDQVLRRLLIGDGPKHSRTSPGLLIDQPQRIRFHGRRILKNQLETRRHFFEKPIIE